MENFIVTLRNNSSGGRVEVPIAAANMAAATQMARNMYAGFTFVTARKA